MNEEVSVVHQSPKSLPKVCVICVQLEVVALKGGLILLPYAKKNSMLQYVPYSPVFIAVNWFTCLQPYTASVLASNHVVRELWVKLWNFGIGGKL